jgi:Bacterial Ig-like domain (group 2)
VTVPGITNCLRTSRPKVRRLSVCGVHFSARLGVADACCLPCLGYPGLVISLSSSYSSVSSFDSSVGQSTQLHALARFSNGTVYDFTDSAKWRSSDTAVATVSGGLVTAVAGGSSQITASISLVAPGVKAFGCGGCPGQQRWSAPRMRLCAIST